MEKLTNPLTVAIDDLYQIAGTSFKRLTAVKQSMGDVSTVAGFYNQLGWSIDEKTGLAVMQGYYPERGSVEAFDGLLCQYYVGSSLNEFKGKTGLDYRPGDTMRICRAMDDEESYEAVHALAWQMAREGKAGLVHHSLVYARSILKRHQAVGIAVRDGRGLQL
ncbi:hypothetical protein ACFL0V_02615 [Nanoarchaeota archaeon]